MLAIETSGLTKRYGRNRGVDDIDLRVARGEVFGFIGPNGAGKSTTIRMLLQLTRPTAGKIALLGERLSGERPQLRRRIGYLPSEIRFYPDMTGRQALELAAAAHGLVPNKTRAAEFAERLQWKPDARIRSYSLGNRKKMGIVLALLHAPELVVLDEPTSGLDPLAQQAFFELLKELNEQAGTTVFFSTHVLSEVEKICERVAFIKDGRIIRSSKVNELTPPGDHIVYVRFREPGDRIAALGLDRLDPNASYADGVHRLRTGSRLQDVLALLAAHPAEEVTVRRPTVEELFMDDYRPDRGSRA